MTKRDVIADELLARAEANGYKGGAHKATDEVCGREKHIKKTKKDEDRTLNATSCKGMEMWHLAAMKTECSHINLPLPDEAMARAECLREGIAAPDPASVKDFLRFYIPTSKPQFDNKSTVDLINTVAE